LREPGRDSSSYAVPEEIAPFIPFADLLPYGIIFHTENWEIPTIFYMNKSARRMLKICEANEDGVGYSPYKFIHKNSQKKFRRSHSFFKFYRLGDLALDLNDNDNDKQKTYEFNLYCTMLRCDKTKFKAEVINIHYRKGLIPWEIMIIRDITDQENKNKRLREYILLILSKREKETLYYLAKGMKISEIARRLKVDRTSAYTYKKRIAKKLKINIDEIERFANDLYGKNNNKS